MATLSLGNSAQVSPFSFGTHAVRVVLRDGEPWFVAKDVCDALGYVNSRDAVADHLDDDEKGVANSDTLGGAQSLTIISESGLYALVLRSRKPEARKFAKWVTGEVLPAIRKTGSYDSAQHSAQAAVMRIDLAGSFSGGLWVGQSRADGGMTLAPMSQGAVYGTPAEIAQAIRSQECGGYSRAQIAQLGAACAVALLKLEVPQ